MVSEKNQIRSERISRVDKEILKVLLEPEGNVSTQVLAKKLGVPLSTVQRRRKHLESKYLDVSYSLNLANLGFRRIDFFLYTMGGNTSEIGLALLKHKAVVSVSRSVGEHTIDLRAEAIIRDNGELLDILEVMKAMPNVRDVIWSEIVDVIGRKKSIPSDIIDSF